MPTPTVPYVFANLPDGPTPVQYLDANFAYILANLAALVGPAFANLPTALPSTPNTLWNNGGVICITPP